MKEKLKAHFLRFRARHFMVAATISLILLDLVNSYYLKLYWVKKDASARLVSQSLRQSGLGLQDLSATTIREMTGFVDNTFSFLLLVILLNNLIFYFFYLRRKMWAQSYILFYSLTAALLAITFVIDEVNMGFGWMMYNILTIPYYLYLYIGVKIIKTGPSPEGGKSAR